MTILGRPVADMRVSFRSDSPVGAVAPATVRLPSAPESSGAIRSHCWLLRIMRFKADLHFSALNSEYYELENRVR